MGKVLVSLVSDQTIPNIEFIHEMESEIDDFLFVSTNKMEKNRQWILDTVKIDSKKILDSVIVDAFSFEDIENKLSEAVNDEDLYIVNLTGGTKVMSLAVYEFFKTVSSEMYYLTGNGEKIKVHPGRKKISSKLNYKISLADYLTAYGFEIKSQSSPLCNRDMAGKLLNYFLHEFDGEKDISVLEKLRESRSKDMKKIQDNPALNAFLNRVGFQPTNENKLTKYECRYLSGDWLEEYLFYFLIDHFNIPESAIGLGLFVDKSAATNEFDVLWMRSNKIYLFECKTSIYKDNDESQTFIGETIYKSDSLRNKLGLFAQTTVVTLSDLGNPKLKSHLERADASRVKLIGRATFLDDSLFEELKKN